MNKIINNYNLLLSTPPNLLKSAFKNQESIDWLRFRIESDCPRLLQLVSQKDDLFFYNFLEVVKSNLNNLYISYPIKNIIKILIDKPEQFSNYKQSALIDFVKYSNNYYYYVSRLPLDLNNFSIINNIPNIYNSGRSHYKKISSKHSFYKYAKHYHQHTLELSIINHFLSQRVNKNWFDHVDYWLSRPNLNYTFNGWHNLAIFAFINGNEKDFNSTKYLKNYLTSFDNKLDCLSDPVVDILNVLPELFDKFFQNYQPDSMFHLLNSQVLRHQELNPNWLAMAMKRAPNNLTYQELFFYHSVNQQYFGHQYSANQKENLIKEKNKNLITNLFHDAKFIKRFPETIDEKFGIILNNQFKELILSNKDNNFIDFILKEKKRDDGSHKTNKLNKL